MNDRSHRNVSLHLKEKVRLLHVKRTLQPAYLLESVSSLTGGDYANPDI